MMCLSPDENPLAEGCILYKLMTREYGSYYDFEFNTTYRKKEMVSPKASTAS